MAEYTIKPGEQILTDTGTLSPEYIAYLKWDKTDTNYDYDKANVVGVGINAYIAEEVGATVTSCRKINLGGGSVPLESGAMGLMRFPVDENTDLTCVGCTVICQEDYKPTGTNGEISSLKLVLISADIARENNSGNNSESGSSSESDEPSQGETDVTNGIIPIGGLDIDENGVYSVSEYAYVVVNTPQTELDSTTFTENGTYTANDGSAYYRVTVDVPTVETEETTITANGTYTAEEGKAYDKVVVNVDTSTIETEELLVVRNGTYTPEEGKTYNTVIVNVPQPTGDITITENGAYNVKNYEHAVVDVPRLSYPFTIYGVPYVPGETTWDNADYGIEVFESIATSHFAGATDINTVEITEITAGEPVVMYQAFANLDSSNSSIKEVTIDADIRDYVTSTDTGVQIFNSNYTIDKVTFSNKLTEMKSDWFYRDRTNAEFKPFEEVHFYGTFDGSDYEHKLCFYQRVIGGTWEYGDAISDIYLHYRDGIVPIYYKTSSGGITYGLFPGCTDENGNTYAPTRVHVPASLRDSYTSDPDWTDAISKADAEFVFDL